MRLLHGRSGGRAFAKKFDGPRDGGCAERAAVGAGAVAASLGMLPIELPLPEDIAGIPMIGVGGGIALIGLVVVIQGFRMF